jgi:hypothetical protein
MKGHPMLMNQHNQYRENGCTTESNLNVQCNPHQNSNDILYRDRKINPEVHMEAQKSLDGRSNPE